MLVKLCAAGALPTAAGCRLYPLPSSGRRRARPAVARANTDRGREQKSGPLHSQPPVRSSAVVGRGQRTDEQEARVSKSYLSDERVNI